MESKAGNMHIDQKISAKKRIEMKMRHKRQLELYMKMKLLIQLKAVKGELYIHILLRLIYICKQILITSLENGHEAYVTDEISSFNLPASFRFYDPILNIV